MFVSLRGAPVSLKCVARTLALASGRSFHAASLTLSESPKQRAAFHSQRARGHRERPYSIGEILSIRHTAKCQNTQTLGDACDMLVSSGRTGAIVMNADAEVVGFLTENDILAALMTDTPPESTIDSWLHGGLARFPSSMVPSFTLKSDTSLVKTSQIMSLEASSDSGFSCHHVLVSDGVHEPSLLSALDLARSMISASLQTDQPVIKRIKAKEAMKKRHADLATCTSNDLLIDAYRVMYVSGQNCVLVEDAPDGCALGVITSTDVLRTFSERQRGVETTVAQWLSALNASEHYPTESRTIRADASLTHAGRMMFARGIHHLVVVGTDGKEVLGILSALDIVRAIGSYGEPDELRSDDGSPTLTPQGQTVARTAYQFPFSMGRHETCDTVGDLVAKRRCAVCPETRTLQDACDIIVSSGRTAAIVVDEHDHVCGVFTENDTLTALIKNTSPDSALSAWLHGELPRFPKSMLSSLSLPPEASLVEASELMMYVSSQDLGLACHHLLVSNNDHFPRVLSALDIARGIIGTNKKQGSGLADMKVKNIMKNFADVVTCTPNDFLLDAYRSMYNSRQNSVLVTGGAGYVGGLHGIITTDDSLRTFSERQHGDETTVARWLRALTVTEHPTNKYRSVSMDASVGSAARIMASRGVHHLVVVGHGDDSVVGTLSAFDIVRALATHK